MKAKDRRIENCIKRLAAFVLLFAVLFSLAFLCVEAGHQCDDDDCAICACLQLCRDQLRQLGGGAVASVVVPFLALIVFIVMQSVSGGYTSMTPVACKVRLNN
ncbi:MAG: hypothetical protein K6E50_07980 [Lachnospiraceae bacterium]|nr:hypothetical protein [Lachnospiraceae bacterium]